MTAKDGELKKVKEIDKQTIKAILFRRIPENNSEITCEDCTIEIVSILENKELIDLAHILVDDNIIASGLSDTLIAYHKPPSGINQTMNIEARIINFLEDDNVEVVDSYNNTININTVNTDPLISNPVFMNINN